MDSGRGKDEEWGADGRDGDVGEQGSIYRCSAEIRSQNKDRAGAELSAWRHERQVDVKVAA